ncbi:chemotaxis protein [Burkholderia sp. L27(2015)]|uniref:chemotaxis protein n=1 Tax=Burkholderia sp. L27(2015) TaxID=1641858 RepID=UPI001C2076E8|nr:chemotaxis protein [Burkholderia sp. L27(2015)]
MGNSTLDPDNTASAQSLPGHDTRALGPSDSSDSGSDTINARQRALGPHDEVDQHALEQGEAELDSDTDRHGTGERASADGDSNLRPDGDVLPDRMDGEVGLHQLDLEADESDESDDGDATGDIDDV